MIDNRLLRKCEENFYGYIHLEIAPQIVCIGIGKFFEQYLKILQEMNVSHKISALIDNSRQKQGMKVKAGDRELVVSDLSCLQEMAQNDNDFIILLTTCHYEELLQQLAAVHISDRIPVFIAGKLQDVRIQRASSYSNLFRYMDMGIGAQGENLTMSILAHDRSELTIRLIDSVCEKLPDFQGKILIGDSKSEPAELDRVKKRMEKCPLDWEILEFDTHYPIPAGKNKLNREVKTDWILQLDNDTYFTENPLEKIQSDLRELGCFVWGLPCFDTKYERVVNYGSNLDFVRNFDGMQLRCCVDLPFYQTERHWPPMLCTYAAGCAMLFRKELLSDIGEYDEQLYMFEDIDFMYRINQKGYKVGNIGMLSLVHDHKNIDSASGKNYEAIRFDMERMNSSSNYFMHKYGFRV